MNPRIDPELREVVASMPAGQFARMSASEIAANRVVARAAILAAGLASDPTVSVEDLEIAEFSAADPVGIRLYRPLAAQQSATPCLIYFHGGAFCAGDLDSEHSRLMPIAALGVTVISVDYRLAPEHPYPAAIDDGYAVLLWAARSALSLGVDPTRIAVGGASAGGCLAAAMALLARDRDGPALCYQMLIYPGLDDSLDSPSVRQNADGPIFSAADMRAAWQHYVRDSVGPVPVYAAPGRAKDLSLLPSAFIMTADLDPLRDQALAYAMRLLAAGIQVEIHNVPGAVHGFDILCDNSLGRAAIRCQHIALRRAFGL